MARSQYSGLSDPLHLILKPQTEQWCVIGSAACFHSQKYIFLSWLLLISFLSAFLQRCKYDAYTVFVWGVLLLHSPALSRWVHPVHQPGKILRFIYSALLSLSPFTHALLNFSTHQFNAADSGRLQQFSYLLQSSELQHPDRTACVYSVWLMRLGLWREGSTNIRRSWPLHIPGGSPVMDDSVNVLWLQAWVGGGISMHPCCDDCSLACTEKQNKTKKAQWLPQHLLSLVWRKNLISTAISAAITWNTTLHISAPQSLDMRLIFNYLHSEGFVGV